MTKPTTRKLVSAGLRWKTASDRERARAEELRTLVIAHLTAGMRPGEVATLSGWEPSQIRKVARAAGLPPARPGRPVKAAR